MKKERFSGVGICAIVAFFCFCGDSGTNAPVEAVTTVPIAGLRLDGTSVPGWSDSGYVSGDSSNVTVSIDGEAQVFKDVGMLYYAQQKMQKAEHTANLLVLDFVTVKNAMTMYARKKQFGVAWGTYDPGKVAINCQEFETAVYAQVNKYYFELKFSVDGDSAGTVASADAFYNKYLALLK
jgi:hypothetical protein